ncbi:CPBP family intramembrane glutamic endopeptidase [Sphingopyxis sp.]|uniref:CPBP family intramembrane glutamic endopeptidase n=1 Tax=Sphingopyxis sp. TaxID=1908224 RepID=UPI002D7681B4|nr:CPBP family intramembrane glutamic endopeptidase [Sphingopyxis sp.]HET6524607.1 CPBP family intramembrane glutamic endopeptidase [Sphingopyxis sp.]
MAAAMVRSLQSSFGVVLLLLGALGIWSAALTLSPYAVDRFPRSERWAFAVIVAVSAPLLVALVHRIANGPAGARRTGSFRSFAFGALCFAIPFALALGAGLASGMVSLRTDAALSTILLNGAAAVALVFLAEAFPEELIFRGAIQSLLRAQMPSWPAIILQALLFTLFAWTIGVAPTWLDASFLFFFGFVLGILRSANAVPAAIGFHLAFMSTQQFLGPAWGLFEVGNPDLMRMAGAIVPFSATIIFLHGRVR